MKVLKFSDSSMSKPKSMHQMAKLVTRDEEGKIVVLSAIGGTNDALLTISESYSRGDKSAAKQQIDALADYYHKFIEELLSDREAIVKANALVAEHFELLAIILKLPFREVHIKDIVAQGELLSTKLFSIYLQEENINHILLPAHDFMVIDSYDEPQIGSIKVKLAQLLSRNKDISIFVTQGNISRNAKGEADNLKIGGSDYSASLIAASVSASVCEIWTDIDGMRNNDPRVVKNTLPIEQLSFEEAAEIAYFGTKILHPASVWPAQFFNVPVRLLNILQPDAKGTLITEKANGVGVKVVAAKDGITAIKIKSSRMLLVYSFLRKVFEVLEKYHITFDMITITEEAVFVSIDNSIYVDSIVRGLDAFGSVEVETNQTIVSVMGNEICETKEVMRKLFESLATIPLLRISYGVSRHNISLLIARNYKEQTLKLLNRGLFGLE